MAIAVNQAERVGGQLFCVHTNLKKNCTRLLIVMCLGIALALYGVYVQTRSNSNPNYMPTLTLASHWLYHNIGQRFANPATFLSGTKCKTLLKNQAATGARGYGAMGGGGGGGCAGAFGRAIMNSFIQPVTRQSGLINASVNVAQIILLMIYNKSLIATDSIIALSAFGLIISTLCLIGSFATCKLMCISCLGIHHIVIIYLAYRRRRLLKSLSSSPSSSSFAASSSSSSPTNNNDNKPSCSGTTKTCTSGSGSGGGGGGGGSGALVRRSSFNDLHLPPMKQPQMGTQKTTTAPNPCGLIGSKQPSPNQASGAGNQASKSDNSASTSPAQQQQHTSTCQTRLRKPAAGRK